MDPPQASSSRVGSVQGIISHSILQSQFFMVLNAPYTPSSSQRVPRPWPDIRPDAGIPRAHPLAQPLYQAEGEWEWINELSIEGYRDEMTLFENRYYTTTIRRGWAGDREIMYINKSWPRIKQSQGFIRELYSYKNYLKPLTGKVVPTIIGVRSSPQRWNVLMQLPHQSFFIEASSDMPEVLKRRTVEALQKIHDKGVCHGSIDLSRFLIGGDGGITVLDYHACKATRPRLAVGIPEVTPAELRIEMRKLKFKLDYEGAREYERDKLVRSSARAHKNAKETSESQFHHYKPVYEEEPEEDRVNPPVDPRIEQWFQNLDKEPTRFIIPGQTVEDFEWELKRFYKILRKMETDDAAHGLAIGTPSLPPSTSEVETLNNSTLWRYALRKRKVAPEHDLPVSPAKRPRDLPQRVTSLSSISRTSNNVGKHARKYGDTRERHIGPPALDLSIYVNNLHPVHPFVVIRDFAYEDHAFRDKGKGKKRQRDEDEESNEAPKAKRRLGYLFNPLKRLLRLGGRTDPTDPQVSHGFPGSIHRTMSNGSSTSAVQVEQGVQQPNDGIERDPAHHEHERLPQKLETISVERQRREQRLREQDTYGGLTALAPLALRSATHLLDDLVRSAY
ncbi:hypothetical protein B0H34DRAFT_683652 [Crassisporium funariophilum]|nr:hypothetical protein B0H34DRAFT_683652 [Crassisporium funariophilum]